MLMLLKVLVFFPWTQIIISMIPLLLSLWLFFRDFGKEAFLILFCRIVVLLLSNSLLLMNNLLLWIMFFSLFHSPKMLLYLLESLLQVVREHFNESVLSIIIINIRLRFWLRFYFINLLSPFFSSSLCRKVPYLDWELIGWGLEVFKWL
jgi:hypothetical protein